MSMSKREKRKLIDRLARLLTEEIGIRVLVEATARESGEERYSLYFILSEGTEGRQSLGDTLSNMSYPETLCALMGALKGARLKARVMSSGSNVN